MSKILEQIKNSAVPAGVMHSAAKGALPLPAAETLEILVHLTHNPVFAEQARMTLARWDADETIKVIADPKAPAEVLGYFWLPTNRRPALMPALIENPAIPEGMLMELAGEERREVVRYLLGSPRARGSAAVMEALTFNSVLEPQDLHEIKSQAQADEAPASASDDETHAAHEAWHKEHATEIAAEEGKPFELSGEDEQPLPADGEQENPGEGDAASRMAAAALALQARSQESEEEGKHVRVLQKLLKLKAAERVKLAFTGTREERAILIRDGAKVVQMAVLASPKLTDPEVETFAAAKNVSEQVLREIARTRRFMKNYNVGRNLVNNPKCPLDLSLKLVKNLLVFDLKGLRFNKSVPETIRTVAVKLYKEKTGPRQG